ncbi:MAG: 2-C-methyl-D-erythritol 4-phosphate cytidylyltransferase [Acidobacteriota bacterium]
MSKVITIIVAAGEGKRFGMEIPKQFTFLKGKPIIEWSVEAFEKNSRVKEIVVVLNSLNWGEPLKEKFKKVKKIVLGGKRRADSVFNGLREIRAKNDDIILIHDGVRPIIDDKIINNVIKKTEKYGAVVPAIPVKDTVKQGKGNYVIRTLDRKKVFRIQTPQGFKFRWLIDAFNARLKRIKRITDDSYLLERIGKKVYMIQGSEENIKITEPIDLKFAEVIIENKSWNRI